MAKDGEGNRPYKVEYKVKMDFNTPPFSVVTITWKVTLSGV